MNRERQRTEKAMSCNRHKGTMNFKNSAVWYEFQNSFVSNITILHLIYSICITIYLLIHFLLKPASEVREVE